MNARRTVHSAERDGFYLLVEHVEGSDGDTHHEWWDWQVDERAGASVESVASGVSWRSAEEAIAVGEAVIETILGRLGKSVEALLDDHLYDVKQVASIIGQDHKFVRNAEQRGAIRRAQGLGRRLLFTGAEVRRFVETLRGES